MAKKKKKKKLLEALISNADDSAKAKTSHKKGSNQKSSSNRKKSTVTSNQDTKKATLEFLSGGSSKNVSRNILTGSNDGIGILGDLFDSKLGKGVKSAEKNIDTTLKNLGSDNERTYFKKGLLEDGLTYGNIQKSLLGTGADLLTSLFSGGAGLGEKVIDVGADVAGKTAGLFGNKEFQRKTEEFIERDLVDEREVAERYLKNFRYTKGLMAANDMINAADKDNATFLGKKSQDLLQSGGEVLALGPLGRVSKVLPQVGIGASAYAGSVEEAYKSGATGEEAGKAGAINAASEVLLGKLFKGVKIEGKALTETMQKSIANKISNKAARTLADYGMDMAGEGTEEVLQQAVSSVAKKLTYEDEKTWKELLFSEEAMDSYIEAFISGAVVSGGLNVGKAVSSIKTGRDYDTGLTENEQKVFDKEIENRTAEKQKKAAVETEINKVIAENEKTFGKLSESEKKLVRQQVQTQFENGELDYTTAKLTKKERAEIEKQVEEDLKAGYIGIDTIESALAGEKTSRINELRKLLSETTKEAEKPAIETELRQLVGARAQEMKGFLGKDNFLQESYRQEALKSQEFSRETTDKDSDITKELIESAKSAGMNNTRKMHNLFEYTNKIANDSKTKYAFVNTEQLQRLGHHKEGKTINGLVRVNEDGTSKVLINVDSDKAINTIIGHETTHLLEGTAEHKKLVDIVKEYATTKGEYDSRLKEISNLYQGTNANIDNEITADLVGDYLFTDEQFIHNLSTKDSNVFQKIYDYIKHAYKMATAGSTEARQLEQVKRRFDKAYKQISKTAVKADSDTETRYSITEIVGQKKNYGQGVLLDTNFFDGVHPRDWNAKLKKHIYDNLAGSELTVYNNGEAETIYLAKATDRVRKDGAKNSHKVLDKLARNRAWDNNRSLTIVHIDELAETSTYEKENNEHTHQWLDENGWELRTAYAMDMSGKIYEVNLNVAKGRDRDILYDVNNIKEVDHGDGNSLNEPQSKTSTSSKNVPYKEDKSNKKRSLASATDEQASVNTSETTSGTASNNNIPIKEDIVNADTEYMAAIKNGDMRSAQDMVQKAAAEAMPNTAVKDENGMPREMYHGTSEKFNAFTMPDHEGAYGRGIYFTDVVSEAADYAIDTLGIEENDGVYVWDGNEYDRGELEDVLLDSGYIKAAYVDVTSEQVVKSKYGDGEVAVVTDSKKIKSADPVTYDDKGNVIPLSERFNVDKEDIRYSVSESNTKAKQLDIILKSNPAHDDWHTWIRSIDDIKTFEETLQDSDWVEYVDEGFNPDYTGDMVQEALSTGKITVYSSYPIENGIFVSPSRMEAESYSGSGRIYSKEVNLSDVAWVDPTQGQYAKVEGRNFVRENGLEPEQLELKFNMTPKGIELTKEAVEYLNGISVANKTDVNYVKTTAKGFMSSLIDNGTASILGHQISSATDLAYAAQVFRDPRYETMRYFFTDDKDKVVFQTGVTSRLPGAAMVFEGEPEEYFNGLNEAAKKAGATKVWILHNHPSGNPQPSQTDISATITLMEKFDELGVSYQGHVVINSNKFAEIHIDPIAEKASASLYGLQLGEDKLLTPEIPSRELGEYINSVDKLAQIAKAMQRDEDISNLIYTTAKGEIRAIQEFNNAYKDLDGLLKENIVNFGSPGVFIATESEEVFDNAEDLIRDGLILDAVLISGEDTTGLRGSRGVYPERNVLDEEHTAERVGGETRFSISEDIAPIRSNYKVQENPLEADGRDIDEVGSRKVKAYMYENPEVKPFFQEEAALMLTDLKEYSVKGERHYSDTLYDTGDESHGFTGTKRFIDPSIGALIDEYKYTREEVEKGLKAIIEDHGAENNAVSKRIEFVIDERLREGYTDMMTGEAIPPNEGYIQLLEDKQITEYSDEAYEAYLRSLSEETPVEPITQGGIDYINNLSREAGIDTADITGRYGVGSLEEMTRDQYMDAVKWLDKKAIAPVRIPEAPTEDIAPIRDDIPIPQGVQQEVKDDGSIGDVPEDISNKTRKELQKELLAGDSDFIIKALENAKNRNRITLNNADTIRATELVFGREAGKKINESIFQKAIDNEARSIYWQNKQRADIKALGIKARDRWGRITKESAAVQKYGEGEYVNEFGDLVEYGELDLMMEFPDEATQEKIKEAARVIKLKYENYIDRANEVLTGLGFDPIPKRKNYMRHFQELTDVFSNNGIPFNPRSMEEHVLPTDINGLTEFWSPQKNFFANIQPRKGKRTTLDAITGIDGYIGGIANLIFHTEDIQRGRAFEEMIRENFGEGRGYDIAETLPDAEQARRKDLIEKKHLSKYAAWVHEWTNNIAGKKNKFDRSVEDAFDRKGFTVLDTLRKQVGANMIGFNLASSLTNLIAPVQAMAKTNKVAMMKGTVDTFKNIVKNDGFVDKNPFLTSRFGTDRLSKTLWEKATDTAYVFMKGMDYFSSNLIVRSKYNELIKKGMSEKEAHKEAGKFAARIMGDRTKGASAYYFNSKALGVVTQFQLEVNNQLYSMFYDTYHESKENAKGSAAKTAAGMTFVLGQLFAFTHIFGKAFENLAGYNPTFDVLGIVATLFGAGEDDEEEKTFAERAEAAALQLLKALPYSSLIVDGGRIPIGKALPITELATGEDEYGNKINEDHPLLARAETAAKALPYYLLPGGYSQIKKTAGGVGMFMGDKPVSGSYTDSGNLRFPVEETPMNVVHAAIFGQWANKNAQDYIDNERLPLKEKQIQEYKELDIPIKDYWDIKEGLKKQDTLEEKFDYIADLDVSVRQKNILINNAVKREERIDMTDYDDYGSYEEFDFATKYPEMYSVAKVVGFDDYMTYSDDLYNLRADKDQYGNSIRNSRKAKVIDYINGLDIDYEMKLILYKKEYNADDAHNQEIIDYLNSRDDISYQDMESILTKLGFTVTSDGTIYW